MRVVAALPAVGLLLGSALGLLLPAVPARLALTTVAVCAVGASWAWCRKRDWLGAAFLIGGFCAGAAWLGAAAWKDAWRPSLRTVWEGAAARERQETAAAGRLLPLDDEATLVIEGTLRSDAAATSSGGAAIGVDVDRANGNAPASGGVSLTVLGSLAAERLDDWRAGRRIRTTAQLRRPSRYLNPGVPDFERSLARRGTTLVGTVKSAGLVEVTARGAWWEEVLADVRRFSRLAIARAVGAFDRRSAAIVAAIVIGDRAGLDADVQRQLQEAGTYHVIAISGGNIAILAGLVVAAFRMAGLFGRSALLLAAAFLVAYAALVGGGASVDRATLMAVVYLTGRAFDQRSPPLNTLAVSAGLLVVAQPLSVLDPAFTLTFGATLAIVVAMPAVEAHGLPRWLRPAVAMCAASIAAETMLLPVGALLFSRITFAGLVLNFAAIPLMGVAQVAGMLVVPLALVSASLAQFAGFVAHLGAAGLVASAGLVRLVPSVSRRVAEPAWWVVTVYYAALVVAWTLARRRAGQVGSAETRWEGRCRRAAVVSWIGAGVWMLLQPWAWVAARGDGRLHVTFIDVGQGDSAFVRFPRGATMLVDAGGLSGSSSFDIGDRVVAPVLRRAGVFRLDRLVLSHGDPDHIGGAPSIATEFKPREVWEGIPVPGFEPLAGLRAQVEAAGLRWVGRYLGDSAVIDDVVVTVRSPLPPDWERRRVRNDDSLVIELRWRDVSMLFTGDIGRDVERQTLTPPPSSPVRIVKVPHHGSQTSSGPAWVEAYQPTVAVISVGRGNRFGHPSPAVLARYAEAGTELFRTDRDGAVELETDGYAVSTHTFTDTGGH